MMLIYYTNIVKQTLTNHKYFIAPVKDILYRNNFFRVDDNLISAIENELDKDSSFEIIYLNYGYPCYDNRGNNYVKVNLRVKAYKFRGTKPQKISKIRKFYQLFFKKTL